MALEISRIPCSPRMPSELLQPIMSNITDLHTLFNLSFTNKFLQYDAEKQLYSSISPQHGKDVSLHLSFLRTITMDNDRCRRLAEYVREYSIDSILRYHEDPLWCLLYAGLRKMVNLKTLNLLTFSGPCGELLLGVPFKLTSLFLDVKCDEESMGHILDEQSELKELKLFISEREVGFKFSEEACPKLEVLWGNRYSIEALLPG